MGRGFIFQEDNTSTGWFSEGKPPIFDSEVIENLKNENIYQYQEAKDVPESLWDQFWNWIGRSLDRIFDALFQLGKPGWFATFVELLPYIVIALVIGLLVYLFFKNNPLRKPNKTGSQSSEVLLNNLSKEEQKFAIDELINKAKQNKNYQLLIRFQYIQVINELDRLKLIQFKSDKTNSEYYNELTSSLFLNDFKQLTYYYEYAWYGDFDVNKELYEKYESLLNYIHHQLKHKHG